MNNKQINLKRLAERHHLLNTPITLQQRTLLENSKYAHVIDAENVRSKFDALFEQFAESDATPVTVPKPRARLSDPTIKRPVLRSMVDEVEDKFGLCAASTSHTKFKSVDLQQLKQFIANFCDEEVYDKATTAFVHSLLDCDDIYSLMGRLYTMCGN